MPDGELGEFQRGQLEVVVLDYAPGMRLHDLTPLLTTLTKISNGRILPGADQNEMGETVTIRIPLRGISPGDRKDVQARRLIRSWLRENLPELKNRSITTSFTEVNGNEVVWILPSGEPVPVRALLEVKIVEVREGDIDRWKRKHRKRRERARREHYADTVKSLDS